MISRVPRHAHGNAGPISRRRVTAVLAATPLVAMGLSARTAAAQSN